VKKLQSLQQSTCSSVQAAKYPHRELKAAQAWFACVERNGIGMAMMTVTGTIDDEVLFLGLVDMLKL